MRLIITATADEIFPDALYWEIKPPFDPYGIPMTVSDWQRQELAKRMREVFTDLTGRSCSAEYEEDDEPEPQDDDPNYEESWNTYQQFKEESARRDAWAAED